MAIKSNVPMRIGGSRTRSGCSTCKRRHLRCDERHPICTRCAKANLNCSYAGDIAQTPVVVVRHSPSIYGDHEPSEVNMVHMFATQLGKGLGSSFSHRLWCDALPRTAQHEPVIWDGMVAICILDTCIRLNSDLLPALRHYNKALHGLQSKIQGAVLGGRLSQDVVLLASLLFTVFECFQNSALNALKHISSGMNLLVKWEAENGPLSVPGYIDRDILEPIFLTLDSQAMQMSAGSFSSPRIQDTRRMRQRRQMVFRCVDDAHLGLTQIFNRLTRWFYAVPQDFPDYNGSGEDSWKVERQQLRTSFYQWKAALAALEDSSALQPPSLLVNLHRVLIELMFDKALLGPSQTAWDHFLPKFREAADLAEASMARRRDGLQPMQLSTVKMTVAMDLVLPLFFITCKCRDPIVRRRTLAMLEACNRREGIWDSSQAASVCEKIIELEEASALENGSIPESARVAADAILDDGDGVKIAVRARTTSGLREPQVRGAGYIYWSPCDVQVLATVA